MSNNSELFVDDVLVVRDIQEIHAAGGNIDGLVAGEECKVITVGDNLINVEDNGGFTLEPDEDGLSWKTFFYKKEKQNED